MKAHPVKLSVIIVTYNVRYFLEQCLRSTYDAIEALEKVYGKGCAEVWVVDNASVDGTVPMVKKHFPEAHLIENATNEGFQKANNRAIRRARGEYILLLNPDTVVQPDTFVKTVRFMDEHADAGALGVKMIDGKGRYWPESKRSFPSPTVAFYKLFGLARLFPHSRTFGRYHLTYLDPEEVHEVEVLSGAYMLIRKSVLDRIGLLEEAFFMYGDDIDLSYRILQAGYKNYYYPHTQIIHYKGESTRKGRLNYLALFYRAMILFVKKHYSPQKARFFTWMLKAAIIFHAVWAMGKYLLSQVAMPLLDFVIFTAGIAGLSWGWAQWHYGSAVYQPEVLRWLVPAYGLLWAAAFWISRADRYPYTPLKLLRSTALGAVIVLLFYAVLPEQYRYSRAVVLLSPLVVLPLAVLTRAVWHRFRKGDWSFYKEPLRRVIWVGRPEHAALLQEIYRRNRVPHRLAGYLWDQPGEDEHYLGPPDRLEDAVHIHKANEIVFFQEDISLDRVFDFMMQLQSGRLSFKIIPTASRFLIGSDLHINHGRYMSLDVSLPMTSRAPQRLFNAGLSLALLFSLPFLWGRLQERRGFLRNLWMVLRGRAAWTDWLEKQPPYRHRMFLHQPNPAPWSLNYFMNCLKNLWYRADQLGKSSLQ